MAIGLTRQHSEEIEFEDLTPKQSLVIAIESVKKLKWNINQISSTGIIACTKSTKITNSETIKVRIDGNIAYLTSESNNSQLDDFGKNEENTTNFFSKFQELCNAYSHSELARMYEEIKPDFVKLDDDLMDSSTSFAEKIKLFSLYFIPTKDYFITPIILNLNIAIFIIMVISGVNAFQPIPTDMIEWGANFRPLTLLDDWWRLITNFFLHIGVVHLLMNMYALLYIGLILEPYLGRMRFSAAYLYKV